MNASDFFNEVVVFGIQILSDFNSVSGNSQSTRCSKMKKYFLGITPFASFVRSAMIRKLESKIYFVWIAPNIDCFEWFDELLRQAEAKVPFLRVMIFLTLSNMDPETAQVRNQS